MSDSHLKFDLMVAMFRRRGRKGKETMLYSDLGPEEQHEIAQHLQVVEGEHPVVVCFRSPSSWLVITTNRVMWKSDAEFKALDNSQLKWAEVVLPQSHQATCDFTPSQIEIATFEDSQIEFQVEPGPPCIGLVNVLLNVARRNRGGGRHGESSSA